MKAGNRERGEERPKKRPRERRRARHPSLQKRMLAAPEAADPRAWYVHISCRAPSDSAAEQEQGVAPAAAARGDRARVFGVCGRGR